MPHQLNGAFSNSCNKNGRTPHKFSFVQVLNVCPSLQPVKDVRGVHEQLIQTTCEPDLFVKNSLVNMYLKCGSMEEVWRQFSKMPLGNVFS
jgi:hypothetical protein